MQRKDPITGREAETSPRRPAADYRLAPSTEPTLVDPHSGSVAQRELAQSIVESPRQAAQRQQVRGAFGDAVQRQPEPEDEELQRKAATAQAPSRAAPAPNRTGLPDDLRSGIESLSGMAMDHVQVHHNSPQPAQLNALAYAQGSQIHLAPGQEQHLPHEAWHVVQQAQGRVRPTVQLKEGVPVNDDSGLEREADLMGAQAMQRGAARQAEPTARAPLAGAMDGPESTVQPKRKFRGVPMQRDVQDVGGYLNTLQTPGHASFVDIVIFALNNHPGFNEIHVHRGAGGVVLQISKKQTGQDGNGTAVAAGTPLFAAAALRAAAY